MDSMRALPVRMRDWLGAKLLLSLTSAVPVLALSGAVLTAKLGLQAAEALLLLLYPLSGALLFGVLGLLYNMLFPRFDWEKEMNVVKNSLSVTLTILTGMLVPMGVGALAIGSGRAQAVMISFCVVQTAAAGLIFFYLTRRKMP